MESRPHSPPYERYRFYKGGTERNKEVVHLYRYGGIGGDLFELIIGDGLPTGVGEKNQLLQVLFTLCERSERFVSIEELRLSLNTMGIESGSFDTIVTKLRKRLGESAENARLILRNTHEGIRLATPAFRDGKLGGVKVYPKWNDEQRRLIQFIDGAASQGTELRISTYGFGSHLKDIFGEHQLKDLKAKILMTDPENTALMNGHFGLREHPTPETCIRTLRSEINWLQKRLTKSPNYELAISDHVPTGFLALTDKRALFGIFPSCGSYHIGPMIEIDRLTDFWDVLKRDWDERWKAGKRITDTFVPYS